MKKSYIFLIIIALLALIVVLGFLFVNTPKHKFASNSTELVSNLNNDAYFFTPDVIAQRIKENDGSFLFVDVRTNHEFGKGHILNAKNIHKTNILDKENLDFFTNLKKESKTAILYGNGVLEANAPFMVLKQMGVENIGIATKGYAFFKNTDLSKMAASKNSYTNNETPVIDFAQFIVDENKKATERAKLEKVKKTAKKRPVYKKKVLIKKKPKATAPVEEEEEEGC